MPSLEALERLAALAAQPSPGDDAMATAIDTLVDALGAADVALTYSAGNGGFRHFGRSAAPDLSASALWSVHHELSTRSRPLGIVMAGSRVARFTDAGAATHVDFIGATIPSRHDPAQMLIARGPWEDGMTAERAAFASAAAPALAELIERRLGTVRAEQGQNQIRTLAAIGQVISETDDLETMLTRIANMTSSLTTIDYVSMDILGPDGSIVLRCLNRRGTAPATVDEAADDLRERWKRGKVRPDPIRDYVVQTREPMLFPDAQNDERLPESGRNYFKRSMIRSTGVFPLIGKDGVVGVLSFAAHRPFAFNEDETQLLEGLTRQIAAAVDGVRLYDDRRRAEDALRRNEELLRATLESTADGILAVGDDGKAMFTNARFVEQWGIPPDILETHDDSHMLDFVLDQLEDGPAFLAKVQELYASAAESLDTIRFKDGRVFERYSRPLLREDGIRGRVWSFRDVTERRRADDAIRDSEQRFRSLVQNASDLITVVTLDTTIIYQSPSIERVLGYPAGRVAGTKLTDMLHPDDVARMMAFLREAMVKPSETVSVEARLRHLDGSWRHVEIAGRDRRNDAAIGGFVLNSRDVSDRKALERQLRHEAGHDPLTHLANRARFTDRLEHALQRAARNEHAIAVVFMDLDNFKAVNDGLGHSAGDALLVEVAERLRRCLRPGDTPARFGGDEFAILLEDVSTAEEAIGVADRVFQALHPPFERDGKELFVRASAGIAMGGAGLDADELLRNADVAMYVAKGRGKGRHELYEETMHVSMVERLELLGELQRAVDHGEFVVHYQPAVQLDTGEIVGVEALVRWEHPERGLLMPAQFIPLAEESGMILPLGRWVLSQACTDMQAWQEMFPSDPLLTIAVNVSVRQIQEPTFVEDVAQVLRESQLPSNTLILEITESVMMHDVEATVQVLRALKALGVRLAIDDFGTGYSSLSYLREFPFDILKIDKSFVDADARANDKELTRAIIDLGRTLQMEIVAEGIEAVEQLSRLRALACERGQGYYFARPLEHAQMAALLSAQSERTDAA